VQIAALEKAVSLEQIQEISAKLKFALLLNPPALRRLAGKEKGFD